MKSYITKISSLPEEDQIKINKEIGDMISKKLIDCYENINAVLVRYGLAIILKFDIAELTDAEIEKANVLLNEKAKEPEKPKKRKPGRPKKVKTE